MLELLGHESNYFGSSLIPRCISKEDSEWKTRLFNEPEHDAWRCAVVFIDGLKRTKDVHSSLLTYLSLPKNGGLILDNETFYNVFLKGCPQNRLIKGNYVLPFLEAAGVCVLNKSEMYPLEESLCKMMRTVASDPNNAHIFSGLDDRIENMKKDFLWLTSSWDIVLAVIELWEKYASRPLYVQEKME